MSKHRNIERDIDTTKLIAFEEKKVPKTSAEKMYTFSFRVTIAQNLTKYFPVKGIPLYVYIHIRKRYTLYIHMYR